MQLDPEVEAEDFDTAWRESLLAQRSSMASLLRDGIITENTFEQLIGEIDIALSDTHSSSWSTFLRGSELPPIQSMMTVFIQEQDAENAINTLNKVGLSVTRLPSTGGLLRKRNLTLLIGIPEGQEQATLRILQNCCRERVDYAQPPVIDSDKPITLSGATAFTFDIERYEEL